MRPCPICSSGKIPDDHQYGVCNNGCRYLIKAVEPEHERRVMTDQPLTKDAAMNRLFVKSLMECMENVAKTLRQSLMQFRPALSEDPGAAHFANDVMDCSAKLTGMVASVSAVKSDRVCDKVEAMMALVNGEAGERTADDDYRTAWQTAVKRAADAETLASNLNTSIESLRIQRNKARGEVRHLWDSSGESMTCLGLTK